MKQLLVTCLFTVTSLLAMAQNEKTPYLSNSYKESVKDVEVQTSGGSISVEAAADTRIEVYVQGNNGKTLSKEEIQQRLDAMYTIDLGVSGNKLHAIAKPKSKITDWKKALSISFKVFVPKDVSTDLATSGGSISISGLNGKQDFTTSGGSLEIKNTSGKVDGRTSGGSIYVKNSKDEIELTTSGGSIYAKNCDGKIKLTTSGGSLHLDDLKGDIKATTSGGSIKGSSISGELLTHTSGGSIKLEGLSCSLDASTSGGGINVSVTSLGKYIKLRNSGGGIDLELPAGKGMNLDIAGNRIKTNKLSNFDGKVDEDEIEGKINGGGIPVEIKSASGTVSLAFK
jgi:hypothetical protein